MKRTRLKTSVEDQVEVEQVSAEITDAHQRADYETQLLIDPDAVDEAIMRQAQTFNDVAERHVEAISRRDDYDDRLKRTEARAEMAIRQKLDETGDKYTEATVKARKLLDKDVREATRRLREAEREAALWGILKESFHQRSHMLGHMAKLYEAGYFQKASVSGRSARKLQSDAYEGNRAALAEQRKQMSEQRRRQGNPTPSNRRDDIPF
jgi:hypothetical protein